MEHVSVGEWGCWYWRLYQSRGIDRKDCMNNVEEIESNLSALEKCGSVEAFFLKGALEELGVLSISKEGIKPLWGHTVKVVSRMPKDDMILRWAALYHDIGKYSVYGNRFKSVFANHEQASQGIRRFRAEQLGMPEEKITAVETVIAVHMLVEQYSPEWTNKAFKKLLAKCGDQIERALILAQADGGNKANLRHLRERLGRWIK